MDIKVYIKTRCPYCQNAVSLLKELGASFQVFEMDDKPDELQEMKNKHQWFTVPMIFLDGRLIGGYQDLKEMVDKGEFKI